jgi:hypothetical protein
VIAQEGADNISDYTGQVGSQERDVAAQIRHLFLHIQENGLVFGDFSQDMPRHEFLASASSSRSAMRRFRSEMSCSTFTTRFLRLA